VAKLKLKKRNIRMANSKKLKLRTNQQIVMELMQSSRFGSMSEVFIVNAIRSYAGTLSQNPEPSSDTSSLIDPRMWHQMAVDTKERIDAMYEENKSYYAAPEWRREKPQKEDDEAPFRDYNG
jgi:hypothetical protein